MPGKLNLLTITLILLLMSPAFGQTCGDVTGDESVNLSDMVYILSYLMFDGPEPLDSVGAEWDDHIGITISDVVAFIDYLFINWDDSLSCGATQPYSFAPSPSDTIFIPAMHDIPDGIDKVQLPVTFSMDTTTKAFYLPMLTLGAGSSMAFELDSIQLNPTIQGLLRPWARGDTAVLSGIELPGSIYVNHDVAFTLHYSRISGGVANIVTELFDFEGAQKWAISNGDGDLYRPVIVTVDVPIPPDSLTVSQTDISFETMAGNTSLDSFYIDFGSTGLPIQFNLTPSEAWILIEGSIMPVLWTTPASVLITVDSDQVPVGVHTGRIDIVPEDGSVVAEVDFISVTLTVFDPNIFPNGDLDCNGIIDLGDLTYMIAYLFIGGPPPQHCQ